MCQSIAEGGKRCFSHEGHAPAKEWKKKIQEAREASAPAEEIRSLQIEYLTTEEGIESLLSSGKDELARKFIARRNAIISAYNRRTGSSKKPYKPVISEWNHAGIHRSTGTAFDPEGFNRKGYDSEGYNRSGYNRAGYDRSGFNAEGYDGEGYNRKGYNRFGLDRQGFDAAGWNQKGTLNKHTGKPYDRNGLDLNGVNIVDSLDRHV